MSTTFTISGTKTLEGNYFPPIELGEKNYELGLILFESYNTIPNVTTENNCFHYGNDETIEIPIGSYELDSIAEYLEKILQERETSVKKRDTKNIDKKKLLHIFGNLQTLRVEILSEYRVDFSKDRSIGKILGFDGVLEPKKLYQSTNLVSILQVNTIQVLCNITGGSYNNNQKSHILFEFSPNVPPGFKLNIVPTTIIYQPVIVRTIDNINIQIVDQNNKPVDFQNELITLRLHLRKCL